MCRRVVPPSAAARLAADFSVLPFRGALPLGGGGGDSEDEGKNADGGEISSSAYLLLYKLNYCVSRLREVDSELAELDEEVSGS